MENQFLSVKTWRGHVLVSESLLPSSTEEKERIYPDCRSSQPMPLLIRRQAAHMATSLPPVPDFWNHEHRGRVGAVIDPAYGCSDGLPVTPSGGDSIRKMCSAAHASSSHSDSTATEDGSPLSSCWTPEACTSSCTSPTDWDDAAIMTGSGSPAADLWSALLTPFPGRHLSDRAWPTQFITPGLSFSLPTFSSPEDDQPLKRRRLSTRMPPTQHLCDK